MEPFSNLRRWHGQRPLILPALPQYLDAVSYNLEAAELAQSGVSRPGTSAWYHSDGSKLYLLGHDTQAIAHSGDHAVRCAISALELGLQVTNYALKIGFPKKQVRWSTKDERPDSFRVAVRQKLGAADLVAQVIDRIFASHQYALFKDYRNWAAHRGAPKVRSPWSPGTVIPVATLAAGNTSPDESGPNEANAYLVDHCDVLSVPFVPSIRALLDDEKGSRPDALGPGIALPAGSQIKLKGNYVVAGDPLMNAEDYRAANPLEIGGESVEVAGETLRVYSAREYAFAVMQTVMFVRRCLSEDWDRSLVQACEGAA
jgi:hypothetical protein